MKDLKEFFKNSITSHVKAREGESLAKATDYEVWAGLTNAINEYVADDWSETKEAYTNVRQEHYFSAEFLVGRSTLNNLVNLDVYDAAKEALAELGYNLTDILEEEVDAALGNGGLGRLAACFMDSSATLNLPVSGYGILYRFGLFRQVFKNGYQTEKPDAWMEEFSPVVEHYDLKQKVELATGDVWAIPCDLAITGYHTDNVNTLRLWKAEPVEPFDMDEFNAGNFGDAIVEKNEAEDIWRVLYPNDESREGKLLRLKQQYFFSSASLKDIIRRHKAQHNGDLSNFAEWNSIQLNDTHPVIAIPELIRLLELEGVDFAQALEIAKSTFAYTNHTVLAEALEKWDVDLVEELIPDVLAVIEKINDAQTAEFKKLNVDADDAKYLEIVQNNQVHMAWLACYTSYSINGVAGLHTGILEVDTLKEWYAIYPERFNNKTNGVTPRRWLRNTNPELSELLTELRGNDNWVAHLDELEELLPYQNDEDVLKRFLDIKQTKKNQLADFIEGHMGVKINPEAQFDVLIKRLHEYKRQLLDAFYILDLYYRIKEDPKKDWQPVVFFFGAKAAPGYRNAKSIIKYINEIAKLVNNDPEVNEIIQVIFVENYNVSKAEVMFPAADVSKQISMAGKEASGTGNMKFMMNGALTLGTLDGANVEINGLVGDENMYLFGATVEEVKEIMPKYDPMKAIKTTPGLEKVVNTLIDGTFDDDGHGYFQEVYDSITKDSWAQADQYYVLGDFASYRETKDRMAEDYKDKKTWATKAWINICKSGFFSSDRTIRDYQEDIWKIDETKI